MNQQRIITNNDDIKTYLTQDKINEFNRCVLDYVKITKELDKKIKELSFIKPINKNNLFDDDINMDLLIKSIK